MKEDWRIRCPKCGRSKLYSEIGGVRSGAASRGKRTFGWCSGCRWLRWFVIEKVWIDENGQVVETKD